MDIDRNFAIGVIFFTWINALNIIIILHNDMTDKIIMFLISVIFSLILVKIWTSDRH